MNAQDLEQRARELLADEYEFAGMYETADGLRGGLETNEAGKLAIRAIVAALRQQPEVDDARMARALEWVRTAARGNVGEGDALRAALIESARTHLPAIEEAIAAYDPNCGARTVRAQGVQS